MRLNREGLLSQAIHGVNPDVCSRPHDSNNYSLGYWSSDEYMILKNNFTKQDDYEK